MKIITITIYLVLFFSCKEKHGTSSQAVSETANKKIQKSDFQAIIDSSDVTGSILIYDLNRDLYYSNDFEWSNKGKLPASTFKIANSIIGLETGVIENDSIIFRWDGKRKYLKSWEQDLNLNDAFQFSCVHCYQEIARKIGAKRMNDYVEKLQYGNLIIDSVNIDRFWLEGESKISQMQQIDFLKRFYNCELSISKRTEHIMRNILLIEETEQYKLSGKSGLSIDKESYNSWLVGYIELQDNTYLFATNLEPNEEFDLNAFIKKRMDITLLAFKNISVIK